MLVGLMNMLDSSIALSFMCVPYVSVLCFVAASDMAFIQGLGGEDLDSLAEAHHDKSIFDEHLGIGKDEPKRRSKGYEIANISHKRTYKGLRPT